MEKMKIAAGIVLYYPDPERLRQNIKAIAPQVDALFVVDNGSSGCEVEMIVKDICAEEGLHLSDAEGLKEEEQLSDVEGPEREEQSVRTLVFEAISNTQNAGIAKALNQLMVLAQSHGCDWMLTLDQDSVCPSQLIETMRPHAQSCPRAGILCPVIEDRSFGIEHYPDSSQPLTPRQECITSASLTRVEAWEAVGGFDERLFIDAVDTDFCLSLHEGGWEVLQVNTVRLLHEIGHQATLHKVSGRTYIAFNHAPVRYFYIARNMVFLSRKHPGFLQPFPWRCILTMTARMLVILLWERDRKLLKCKEIIRGLRAGLKIPLAP